MWDRDEDEEYDFYDENIIIHVKYGDLKMMRGVMYRDNEPFVGSEVGIIESLIPEALDYVDGESNVCAFIDHDKTETTYIVAKCINGRFGISDALKKIKERLDSDLPFIASVDNEKDYLTGSSVIKI